MNLLFLGLVGEYLGRVYEEVKRRPLYVADQIVRRSGEAPSSAGEFRVERVG